ncbi:MAG: hypothetical protein AAF587_32905 [Bacteroidota bacterium]
MKTKLLHQILGTNKSIHQGILHSYPELYYTRGYGVGVNVFLFCLLSLLVGIIIPVTPSNIPPLDSSIYSIYSAVSIIGGIWMLGPWIRKQLQENHVFLFRRNWILVIFLQILIIPSLFLPVFTFWLTVDYRIGNVISEEQLVEYCSIANILQYEIDMDLEIEPSSRSYCELEIESENFYSLERIEADYQNLSQEFLANIRADGHELKKVFSVESEHHILAVGKVLIQLEEIDERKTQTGEGYTRIFLLIWVFWIVASVSFFTGISHFFKSLGIFLLIWMLPWILLFSYSGGDLLDATLSLEIQLFYVVVFFVVFAVFYRRVAIKKSVGYQKNFLFYISIVHLMFISLILILLDALLPPNELLLSILFSVLAFTSVNFLISFAYRDFYAAPRLKEKYTNRSNALGQYSNAIEANFLNRFGDILIKRYPLIWGTELASYITSLIAISAIFLLGCWFVQNNISTDTGVQINWFRIFYISLLVYVGALIFMLARWRKLYDFQIEIPTSISERFVQLVLIFIFISWLPCVFFWGFNMLNEEIISRYDTADYVEKLNTLNLFEQFSSQSDLVKNDQLQQLPPLEIEDEIVRNRMVSEEGEEMDVKTFLQEEFGLFDDNFFDIRDDIDLISIQIEIIKLSIDTLSIFEKYGVYTIDDSDIVVKNELSLARDIASIIEEHGDESRKQHLYKYENLDADKLTEVIHYVNEVPRIRDLLYLSIFRKYWNKNHLFHQSSFLFILYLAFCCCLVFDLDIITEKRNTSLLYTYLGGIVVASIIFYVSNTLQKTVQLQQGINDGFTEIGNLHVSMLVLFGLIFLFTKKRNKQQSDAYTWSCIISSVVLGVLSIFFIAGGTSLIQFIGILCVLLLLYLSIFSKIIFPRLLSPYKEPS